MHDPLAVRDHYARTAARPSVHRIRWLVTLGMVLAMLITAALLLGLCWGITAYLVDRFYDGFDGAHMQSRMIQPSHVLSLIGPHR